MDKTDLDVLADFDQAATYKRTRVCLCGHKLSEHEGTEIAGETFYVGTEECRQPDCDCERFRLASDQ
jgi:hypothetical protein